jgi:hypothetical protein
MTKRSEQTIVIDRPTGNHHQAIVASMIIAVVIFAAYSVVLSSTFGIMDDYCLLLNAIIGSNDTLTMLIGCGRPLNGVLLDLGFRLTGSIENLVFLRTITLVGIWLLGCSFYFFSRKHGVGFISSLAIACGVVLLPSFQVYASWAQHFTTPFAGVIALLSAYIMTPVGPIRQRSRIWAILLSALLLLTSILIYQPIAMLFCTGILLSLIAKPDIHNDWKASRIIDTGIAFASAMVLGLLVFKIAQYFHPNGASRYGLVQNVQEKVSWFFYEPLANAFSLFSVPPHASLRFVVIATILFGALFFIKRHGFNTAVLIIIYGVFCLLGSYTPNLATAENWASYRSIGALSASVVVLLVLMVSEIITSIQTRYSANQLFVSSTWYHWLALTIVVMILTIQAQNRVINGFVLPNVTELNNVASALRDGKNQDSDKIAVVIRPSSWNDSAARPLIYDEFGMPSSTTVYYARAIVEIVLRSMNAIPNAIIAEQQLENNQDFVVDFRRLVTSQRFQTSPSALLHLRQNTISSLNINDNNWKNGIWINKNNPEGYGFMYNAHYGDKKISIGNKLKFYKSGIRTVLRVDISGTSQLISVEGAPLSPEDGYPHPIVQLF